MVCLSIDQQRCGAHTVQGVQADGHGPHFEAEVFEVFRCLLHAVEGVPGQLAHFGQACHLRRRRGGEPHLVRHGLGGELEDLGGLGDQSGG